MKARKSPKVLGPIVFLAALLLLLSTFSYAQDYSFSVPKNYSDIYINDDGSITIAYEITFFCDRDAHPIDIVDIGLPNYQYDIKSAWAWIDNVPIYGVYPSSAVSTGVEIYLMENAIMPGETGTLRFEINNPQMIYTDDDRQDYASVEFSPTFFGSAFTHDKTDLVVNFHFPKGVGPDETIYHYRQFDSWGYDDEGRIVFTWRDMSAKPSKQYMFGVSFPRGYVETVYDRPKESVFGNLISRIYIFIRTRFLLLIIIGIFLVTFYTILKSNLRKFRYHPPTVSIEGVGIKRGLLAPEAALLLGLPIDKVVTMILFGLLKKGIVRVEGNGTPKVFEVEGADVSALSGYEVGFLKSLESSGMIDNTKLRNTMVKMVKSIDKKIKGFSRRETKGYYWKIVKEALDSVKAAKTPELLGKGWEDNLEWILIDRDYDDKIKEIFSGKDVIIPRWYKDYNESSHAGGKPGGHTLSGKDGGFLIPGANLANNFVTGVEDFSAKFVSDVESFLSSVKKFTNPPLMTKKSTSSSKSSGAYRERSSDRKSYSYSTSIRTSGGSACACACAGCACACAGGGR